MKTISEIEQAKHAEERGLILYALREDFNSRMTSTGSLRQALNLLGRPMMADSLEFHLNLLFDSGYVKVWRACDLPGFRTDRPVQSEPDRIMFARLLPKGLQLIDGQIASDPSVTF